MITDDGRRKAAATKRTRSTSAILEAAIQLSKDFGLLCWTMLDVARNAGVSEATVYRYFPSKLELIHAANEASDVCLLCGHHEE